MIPADGPFRPRAFRSLLLLVAMLGLGMSVHAQSAEQGIVVRGTGIVMGEPDVAKVVLGVDIVEADLATALDEADAAMAAVQQALVDGGVETRDIRTNAFNIWREDVRDDDGTVTGQRFHVTHTYDVTVRALDTIGTLIPAAVTAGANNVGGISFTISDTTELERQARQAAMADAKDRAEQLASAGGVILGAPLAIEETSGVQAPRPTVAFARAAESAPIAAGQLAIEVDVTVRYQIR